jgi:DNA-binding response OmpR family regulator
MPERTSEPHCLIVADGEVLIRNALAAYLRDCGYKVIEAASSDEVVAVLEDGAATPHLILSDAVLGGTINAFELRLWVRERFPDVHIVLAGSVDAAAKAAGQICEEGGSLPKPYDPQAVVQHIKRLLARGVASPGSGSET